jgi:hypothetical protein
MKSQLFQPSMCEQGINSAGAFNCKKLSRFQLILIDILQKNTFYSLLIFENVPFFECMNSNFQKVPICPRKNFHANFSTSKKAEFYANSKFF